MCCTFFECKTAMDNNLKQFKYDDIRTVDPSLFIKTIKEKKLCVENKN